MSIGLIGRPQRSAQAFNGTSSASSVALTTLSGFRKISISSWRWWNAFANDDKLGFELSPSAFSNNNAWVSDPNNSAGGGAANKETWTFFTSAANAVTAAYARPTPQVWHHMLHTLDETTTGSGQIPAVYIDGVAQSLTFTATGGGNSTFQNYTLFLMCRNNASLFAPGGRTQFAMWFGQILSAQDAIRLASGVDPRSVAGGATHFWPMAGAPSEPNMGRFGSSEVLVRASAGQTAMAAPAQFSVPTQYANQGFATAAAPTTPATIPSAPQIWSPLTLGAAAWKMGKLIEENRPLTRRGLLLPRRRIAGVGE